jgi:nucleotide-binding universal stress UspA family protein
MAHRFAAKVVFMQTVESHVIATLAYEAVVLDAPIFEQEIKEAKVYLTSLCSELREKGIEAQMCVEHGPIVKDIIDVAAREGADLIAMASHGRGGLSRVFYGSVAAGILQRVDRPLLLVRSQGQA